MSGHGKALRLGFGGKVLFMESRKIVGAQVVEIHIWRGKFDIIFIVDKNVLF